MSNINNESINENSETFDNMFNIISEKNRQIQENNDLIKEFFKFLNYNSIQELVNTKKIGNFLDSLIPFLETNTTFTALEKKKFLNGCENFLFLQSLLLKKFDYAKYLNNYRLDKKLFTNRDFLFKRIKEEKYDIVEQMLELSTDVDINNNQILKLLYNNMCRDYRFFKRIIEKNNLNINDIGEMGLDEKMEGSFVHLVAITSGRLGLDFFNKFIKDYGNFINYDLFCKKHIEQKENNVKKITIVNDDIFSIIINHKGFDAKEKLLRLTNILNYSELNKSQIEKIFIFAFDENILSLNSENIFYSALFSSQVINSTEYPREEIIEKILKLDNNKKIKEVRSKNSTLNPIKIVLETFLRLSSPINEFKRNPVLFWLELNKYNNDYCQDTLNTLMKYYKQDLNTIGINKFKFQEKILQEFIKNGYKNKNSIFSNLFKKSYENDAFKEQDLKEEVIAKKSRFNLDNIEKIKDLEIKDKLESIIKNRSSYKVLAKGRAKKDDIEYMKTSVPNLVNKTIENYLTFLSLDRNEDAKSNTIMQLNLIHKKTSEMLFHLMDRKVYRPEN